MERPKPYDPSALPRDPKDKNPDTRPATPPDKAKVTPLDEDKNIEDGIEVNET